jgi:hypothetical protein
MEKFDAVEFVARLQSGEFDGHLSHALNKLTHEQLQQVERLLIRKGTGAGRMMPEDLKRSE